MKLIMIGAGYVGLVSGACFAEFGFEVTCIDKDQDRIHALTQGHIPIYEPGLEEMVQRHLQAGRLQFTTDLSQKVPEADIIFIAVGTPSRRGDGHADLTYVFQVAEEIAPFLKEGAAVVIKSTVPVGTGRQVAQLIRQKNPGARFSMVSNPEFLREGSALEDFLRPDRVIVGLEEEGEKRWGPAIREKMRALYRPLYLFETPVVFTDLETSEMIKYASNAFLALKIGFINQIADLCEKTQADVQKVAQGIGLDKRIGSKFLHPGPGYGGSCFPKDTLALVRTSREYDTPLTIVEAVVDANNRRKSHMVEKVIQALGGKVEGRRVAVLGVSFKPQTDDMREAPSLVIIPGLQEAGALVSAYDPAAMTTAAELLPGVSWASTPYEALDQAEAALILTEWNEFRALDLERVKVLLKTEKNQKPLVIDLRNIYDLEEMRQAGFHYISIGRKPVL